MAKVRIKDLPADTTPDDADAIAIDSASEGTRKVVVSDLKTKIAPVGTTAGTVAAGDDSRLPTSGEKSALAGTSGSPGSGNKFVTDADSRVPTQSENDALAGTSGSPSSSNKFVTNADSRLTDQRDALSLQGKALDATTVGSPSDGQILTYDNASGKYKAKTPAASSPLLFAWNESDTTQFQLSVDEIDSGGTVLSVQNPSRNGSPRLRVAFPTKVTGEKLCAITIKNIDLTSLASKGSGRFRYVFEYTMIGGSITLGEWYATGPMFLCADATGASFYGLGWGSTLGVASRGVHVKGGTVNLSGSTPGWRSSMFTSIANGDGMDKYRVIVEAVKVNGAQPFFVATLQMFGLAASQQPELAASPIDATWNTIAAFSTSWNSVVPATVGFFVLGTTGTTTNQYFEFADIRVSKHPMDF